MSTFLEIAGVAFAAQLAVLPGEKVQFIIAGLSTEYDPKVVVAAAGSAFAIWTAVEIAVGSALKRAIPGVYLDVATAVLFVAFGVLLLRSMPAADADGPMTSDGGVLALDGRFGDSSWFGRLPNYLGGFVPIFAMMFFGEFGDKTQIITIGLAADYGATPAIWVGEMAAIIPVSILNAMFFSRFAGAFDARRAHLGSAALFFFFAFDTALSVAFGVSVWEELVAAAAWALEAAIGALAHATVLP
ncbi:TMEM165/GDT1 family protein [Halobacterium litoreum]|uniref:TMEM165/GDT1 family protein n=1 Tax=Halobacterium litoreum TaxID=2039234 RepID=A0ABD5NI43_9EURY|nr:TMEM165/GDT1 family protein [Halobacterium litoreum]UHH12506.1 TMEM165/GDT1 family protein [Halobacterium litoreum]